MQPKETAKPSGAPALNDLQPKGTEAVKGGQSLLSNVLKSKHDAAKAIVEKMG